MSDPYDLFLDPTAFNAEVIFVGTRCGRENLLHKYTTGTIHFVRGGRARVDLPCGTAATIEEPSLVFFPRPHEHRVQPADDGGIELVCAIATFGDAFRRAIALSFPDMVVLPLARLEAIRHTLEAFFAEAASQAPGSRQMADKLCGILLAYLARHLFEQGRQQSPPATGLIAAACDKRIACAIAAIHSRFEDVLDLETLARGVGMSRTRFVELFGRLVGTSPHNYLVNYRIGMAQQMLATRLPVKTVAARVGYGTTSAFVRKFKQVVGVSPGAWAK
ncbi:MAG: AraC family transcriptional regulator [Burkholderiales bacterium]|nr:AraC family transcriptional regulator [Burkholderiales bacterium]